MNCKHRYFGFGCIKCGKSQRERAIEAETALSILRTSIEDYLEAVDSLSESKTPNDFSQANTAINTKRLLLQNAVVNARRATEGTEDL